MGDIYITKANGGSEIFKAQKLANSLKQSGAEESLVKDIVKHIEAELKDGMSTSEIYKHAYFLLKKARRDVAMKYSLKRAIMELGPSGFPFEKFIAEIFKAKGYETRTGEMVMGGCVAHEIDVVAWNENKLIMAEAKFHNQIGLKSDLKVVLYVKARYDDIKETKQNYGRLRFLDEGWLVTNTKFTSTAIHYAECKGVKLVGWNYPANGSLHQLIDDAGVHPITCITSLTKHQKGVLIEQNIVLINQLAKNSGILKSFGFDDKKIGTILEEIATIHQ